MAYTRDYSAPLLAQEPGTGEFQLQAPSAQLQSGAQPVGTYTHTPNYGVRTGQDLDVSLLNDMSKKAGIAPVAAPHTAITPTDVSVNSSNMALKNPLTDNAVAKNKSAGMQMDWGKFAEVMNQGDSGGGGGAHQYNSDMNNLYAEAREADRKVRAGNGPEHFATAMSIFGSIFGGGMGGGAGAAGGGMLDGLGKK